MSKYLPPLFMHAIIRFQTEIENEPRSNVRSSSKETEMGAMAFTCVILNLRYLIPNHVKPYGRD
ncbi:MAG: hypothetical protein ACFFDN_48210 [Candidatus Hodarchaeota archaeon]